MNTSLPEQPLTATVALEWLKNMFNGSEDDETENDAAEAQPDDNQANCL